MLYLFETERLGFRKFESTDLNFLFELDSDPEVIKFVDSRSPKSIDEVNETLNRIIGKYTTWGNYGVWVAEMKVSRKPIGWFALKPLPGFEDIEIGYRLLQKYWGQGYATEGAQKLISLGFDQFGLKKIVAITDPENMRSQAVLRKVGFTNIGKRIYRGISGDKNEVVDFFELTPIH